MRLRRLSLTLLFVLAFLAGPAWAQDAPAPDENETDESAAPAEDQVPTYELALQIQPGKWVLKQQFDSESYATVDGVGQPTQQLVIAAVVPMEISAAQDDLINASLEIQSLAVTVTVGTEQLKYATGADQSEQNPMLADLLDPLDGSGMQMTLTRDGQVRSVKGRSEAVENMTAANSAAAPMLQGLKNYFGDVASGDSATGQLLPDQAVRVGETWNATLSRSVDLLGKLSMSFTCQLDRIDVSGDEEIATISFTGTARDEQGAGTMELGGSQVRIDSFQSEQSGQFRLDLKTGQIRQYQVRQTVKAKIAVDRASGTEKKVSLTRKSQIRWNLEAAE
ncbi:MAG: DUF6263 family protein [Phycisphaerae bacterium]